MKKSIIMLFMLCSLHDIASAAGGDYAKKLAESEFGRPVDDGSLELSRARHAIEIAKSVCKQKDDKVLSDAAYKTAQFLRGDGIYSMPIEILEAAKAINDGVSEPQDCIGFMAKYATIRESTGYTHSEAVSSMRMIWKSAGAIVR